MVVHLILFLCSSLVTIMNVPKQTQSYKLINNNCSPPTEKQLDENKKKKTQKQKPQKKEMYKRQKVQKMRTATKKQ